jgi:hypothetical protein
LPFFIIARFMMPTYDYRCDANDRELEVMHRMSEQMNTWGELCERAGIDPGDTPPDSPVRRLATGGHLVGSSSLANPEPPPSMGGGCCGGGSCGIH